MRRRSSATTPAPADLRPHRRRRTRRRDPLHRAPSAALASWTAAPASAAAPGAPPPWGSSPAATKGRPTAGGRPPAGASGGDAEEKEERRERRLDLRLLVVKNGAGHPAGLSTGSGGASCWRRRRHQGEERLGFPTLPAPRSPFYTGSARWAGWAGPPKGRRQPTNRNRPAPAQRPHQTALQASTGCLCRPPRPLLPPPICKLDPQLYHIYIFRHICSAYLSFSPCIVL